MNDAINPVTLCQELVRIQSVNPGGCEDQCAQLLGNLLLGGGFEVTYHDFAPGRTSVVARKGGAVTALDCALQAISTPCRWALMIGAWSLSAETLWGINSTGAARRI